MEKSKYTNAPCSRKEGLLYGSHLIRFFEHFKVDFSGYAKEKVKSTWIVRKEYLKNMKI